MDESNAEDLQNGQLFATEEVVDIDFQQRYIQDKVDKNNEEIGGTYLSETNKIAYEAENEKGN